MGKSLCVHFAIFFLSGIANLCVCRNSGVRCLEREKQALLEFKATIIADPSNRLYSWNDSNNDCCHWNGVVCDYFTGHVLKLDLNPCPSLCDSTQLALEASHVDPSLMKLKRLSYLDLSQNQFHASQIPLFFASMHQLKYLSLSKANFSGKVPYNFRNLTNLIHLDLSFNDLQINDMNWVSGLQSLQELDMSAVELGKAHDLFQVLYKLPSLSHLNLASCGIHTLNPLHGSLNNFSYAPKVRVLYLTDNSIDSQSLDAVQNMTSVTVLDLSLNNIKSLPMWLSKFDGLEELHVDENELLGSFPLALRNLSSLRLLDLSSNNLTGSVPSWLAELNNLQTLSLASNNLTSLESPLSLILSNMCRLRTLDFSQNKFQGEAFGSYALSGGCIKYDLENLDLSYNKFEDKLPFWFGKLENLREVHISITSFYGPIPLSVGNLSRLTRFDLVNNRLNGSIPNSLAKLVNLTYLRLSGNQLEGTIPNSLSNLVNLQVLDLSNNHIKGIIPQSLGHLANLQYLVLGKNDLHGNIPGTLSKLVKLIQLDLSSNNLKGEISVIKEWPSFEQLKILNLYGKHITGSLPKSFGDKVPNLEYLLLGNNLINGSIPSSLCKISTLYQLDLSKNEFSGEIPDCWRDNQQWDEINLSSNNLSGGFPRTFGNLSSLLWLHLNNNSLQGELPSLSLRNLKKLLILDIGENQFVGSIPPWSKNIFSSLKILRLRQNNLNGSIPSQICQLTSLQILDLASNNLTGSIPDCIGNLKGMTKSYSMSNEEAEVIKFDFSVLQVNFIDEWLTKQVEQVLKGMVLEYVKILKLLVNLDLSDNKLEGNVPEGITQLIGLHGLNLSHNHLKGEIPQRIGELKSLESFDISWNHFFGKIPDILCTLSFLSSLNLSYNNLSGTIPIGNQCLTLKDQYNIYAGNPNLCGVPLLNKCSGGDQVPDEDKDDDSERVWFYIVVAVGFAVGFWAVIGTLMLKKRWRYACFRRVEDAADEIYVTFVLKVAKLKKMCRNNWADG